jgi:hypothetical protein
MTDKLKTKMKNKNENKSDVTLLFSYSVKSAYNIKR